MKYARISLCILLSVLTLAGFHYVSTRESMSALIEAAGDETVAPSALREKWSRDRIRYDLMWRGGRLDAVEEDLFLLERAGGSGADDGLIRERIRRRAQELYRSLSPSFADVF
ncbi:MAG: hypothetical protein II776_07375 [Clostridia bacterium]|nr:hypothetical protein [Clostridia bacterium]